MRRVQRGERIQVTDGGYPVALLSPIQSSTALDSLEAGGRIVRAEGDLLDLGPPLRATRRTPLTSSRLAALRLEER